MTVDPTQLAADLNAILSFAGGDLNNWLVDQEIPPDIRAAIQRAIASSQAVINSTAWPKLIQFINELE